MFYYVAIILGNFMPMSSFLVCRSGESTIRLDGIFVTILTILISAFVCKFSTLISRKPLKTKNGKSRGTASNISSERCGCRPIKSEKERKKGGGNIKSK